MKMFNNFLEKGAKKIRVNDLSLVWLAVLLELLTAAYVIFLFLFSLEMLLPTFVSSKISLVKFSGFLFLFTFAALGLGRMLQVRFSFALPFRKTLFALTPLWLVGILSLALLKFPLWALPVLMISALAVFYFFLRLLITETDKS